MAVGTEIGWSLGVTALFAEESLPIGSQGQCRTTVRACCRIPTFRTLDQSRETTDVEEKHGVFAVVKRLPEESHSGCEENSRWSRLFLDGIGLTAKNEDCRFAGRVLND
jgi:hypothetical protein